ncbi:flavin-binding monooxygenase [Leptodontidium sp. MPI-SDFR-AT-0119]|nr:flavin-binding monooxygenase [Leptodontidium sp. MPI-SDFR-AT-0119]
MESTHSNASPLTLKDAPVENLRPLKVRVIGAGYACDIPCEYLHRLLHRRVSQVFLDLRKIADKFGYNTAHSYQYSFEPNPTWLAFYAPAEEICNYLTSAAEKYNVLRFVKLRHRVTQCVWDDSAKKWKLEIENVKSGETFEDDCDVLVNARGIIGGGSSFIQIAPNLQKLEGIKLNCFVRSKAWISNPFGDNVMKSLGLDLKTIEFSPEQIQAIQTDPESYLKFRQIIEREGNSVHALSLAKSEVQTHAVEAFTAMMRQRLGKKPEIADFLIPSFAVGCRRLTPGPGYLEALVEDNVKFINGKIAGIMPRGIKMDDGSEVELDVLVCATGFQTTTVPFPIIGRNEISLAARFTPYAETYLSMCVDGFPNYFMMLGPNSAIRTGSQSMILEAEGDYIIKCVRKLQKEDYFSIMPKPARVRDFQDYVGEYFKHTVYMDQCQSWYRSESGQGGRITGLWPGSTLHALETMRAPRWEDFELESREQNKLRWLGNGWSVTQIGDGGDPAWYLDPTIVDVPREGEPEKTDMNRLRPFSY